MYLYIELIDCTILKSVPRAWEFRQGQLMVPEGYNLALLLLFLI